MNSFDFQTWGFVIFLVILLLLTVSLYLFIHFWSFVISEVFMLVIKKLERQGIKFKFIEYNNKTNIELLNDNDKNIID